MTSRIEPGVRAVVGAILVALATAGPATAQTVPACVAEALKAEARPPSSVPPPPSITPASGRSGTPVAIEAPSHAPGTVLTFIALYGERDCTIAGLGDQFLGQATSMPDGVATLERAWPATFEPTFGRGATDPVALPSGRYWIVAVACEERGACALGSASEPGGPFRQLDPADRTPVVLAAGAGVVGAGVVVVVRRRRRRAR